MPKRILFLDDDPQRWLHYSERKNPENNITWVQTAQECVDSLSNSSYSIISLDHDLGFLTYVPTEHKNTGSEVVREILKMDLTKFKDTLFIVHSYNEYAANNMVKDLKKVGLMVLRIPFKPN